MSRLRVLVVEPYFSGSHRAWAEGLARHSRHRVRLVTHDGAFWKWRMQGGALTLAGLVREAVAEDGRPDVLMVSDMVHVPALLGFLRAELAGVPVVLYLHENQLTYPPGDVPAAAPDHTYAMTNWLSMAAADVVVFNSSFHRRDLLGALPAFLKWFPDYRHTGEVAAVEARSRVVPVGVDVARLASGPAARRSPPLVLWNHRWEYDKDPAAFFDALSAVAAAGIEFRVAVAGERFHNVPPEFERGRVALGERVVHFGMASAAAYPGLLRQADVVVSTSRHEFFGVAVVEAIAAGALPVLPNRLSYPELVPASSPYLYGDAGELVERLVWALTDEAGREAAASAAQAFVARFDWAVVAPQYDALFEEAAAGY